MCFFLGFRHSTVSTTLRNIQGGIKLDSRSFWNGPRMHFFLTRIALRASLCSHASTVVQDLQYFMTIFAALTSIIRATERCLSCLSFKSALATQNAKTNSFFCMGFRYSTVSAHCTAKRGIPWPLGYFTMLGVVHSCLVQRQYLRCSVNNFGAGFVTLIWWSTLKALKCY